MKKFILLFIGLVIGVGLSLALLLFGIHRLSADWDIVYLPDVRKEKKCRNGSDDTVEVHQCSMEYYGFYDKHSYPLYYKSHYFINDIISFTCHKEGCDGEKLIKRIDTIKTYNNETCYWLSGSPAKYTCPSIEPEHPDKLYISGGSHSFDWLCGDEIDIMGVVLH